MELLDILNYLPYSFSAAYVSAELFSFCVYEGYSPMQASNKLYLSNAFGKQSSSGGLSPSSLESLPVSPKILFQRQFSFPHILSKNQSMPQIDSHLENPGVV